MSRKPGVLVIFMTAACGLMSSGCIAKLDGFHAGVQGGIDSVVSTLIEMVAEIAIAAVLPMAGG